MDSPPVQYVKTSDGYDIAYTISGEGRPLVLLPNAWSHIQLFWRLGWRRSLFEALAARFRLIQFDGRGQGLSKRGLGPEHSRESYCLDLDAVVERLGLDRFVLLARNLFCQVAVEYALRNPAKVEALILGNPAGKLYQGFEGIMQRQWDLYTETIARLTNLPDEPSNIAAHFRLAVDQADHVKLLEALTLEEVPSEIARLRTPTLIIDSSTSPLSSKEWRLRLAAAIPNAQVIILDDPSGGFFSTAGEPPPAVSTIAGFLESLHNLEPPASGRPLAPSVNRLSIRETEVLRLVAAGRSNPQIADELVISLNTVQRHVSNILAKTGVTNRTEASVYARDHGIA